jgi:hypothetical protein
MFTTANGNPCDVEPGSVVRHGHVPNWFRLRMLTRFGPTEHRYTDGRALFEYWARLHTGRLPWIDHIGSALVGDQRVVVSEPYLRATDDFTEVRGFAAMLNCELVVSEQSYWFPGKTLRLAFVSTTNQ